MAGMRDRSGPAQDPVSHSTHHDSVPDVGRPRGSVWRPLYAEGIMWEGQVFIVGGEHDLAARLILTKVRLALISGGDIALEAPRRWLQPDARLSTENMVVLFLTPDGAMPGS